VFNDVVVKLAQDAPVDHPAKPFFVYAAGKTAAERAAWNWLDTEKPSFQLNTVLPALVFCEIINPNSDGSTAGAINKVVKNGDLSGLTTFLTNPPYFVDVKDTARIHVAALLEPDVQHERLWAAAAPLSLNEVLGILRSVPEKDAKIPNDLDGFGEPTKVHIENSRTAQTSRKKWVGQFERESLLDQVNQL